MNEEQLKRLTQLENSNDCPSRYIRLMADEILTLRDEVAELRKAVTFRDNMKKEALKYLTANFGGI